MRPDVARALGLFWAGFVPQLALRGFRGLMPRPGGERVADLGGGFGARPQDLDGLLAILVYELRGGLLDRRRVARAFFNMANAPRSGPRPVSGPPLAALTRRGAGRKV